jgi:cell division protein FtsL
MSNFLSWVTHGVKRGRFDLDARAAFALLAIVTVLTLVMGTYLALVSRTAAQGRYIERLQAQIFQLQRENERMAVRVAEASALPRVMDRAEALGFVPAERVEFLVESD